jgi:cell division inhibitor SepF
MQRFMTFLGFSEAEEDGVAAPESSGNEPRGRRGQVLSLHAQRQQEIVVLAPRSFDDARLAADYLKMRRPVVVNLRDAQGELAQRIVDFSSGVTYALNGHMRRVGEAIFLFTPDNVIITADVAPDEDHTLFPLE